MKNLKTSICLYIFLVPFLTIFFIETAFAYPEENVDSWDYAFSIGEKCFESDSDATTVGQIDGNFCMANALQAANKEMNTIYKKMLSVLVEGKMLRESQRA